MLEVKAKPFVEASRLLAFLQTAVIDPKVKSFEAESAKIIVGKIDELIEQLRILEQDLTVIAAKRLKENVATPGITPAQCREYLNQVVNRLPDGLASTFILALSKRETELYQPALPLFAKELVGKFDSAIYEVEQGAKCLALGLSTAAAFHFIRCLEAAIRAVTRSLGMLDPTKGSQRNWAIILQDVNVKLDQKFGPKNTRIKGDALFFETIVSSLGAMQNPYRNATMHLDAKYTEQEARHIMELVAGIMRTVVSRMDENGLPLA